MPYTELALPYGKRLRHNYYADYSYPTHPDDLPSSVDGTKEYLVYLWNRHNDKIPIEEARDEWEDTGRTTITAADLDDVNPNGREVQRLLNKIGQIPNAYYYDPIEEEAYWATYVHSEGRGSHSAIDAAAYYANTPSWIENQIGKKPDIGTDIRRCYNSGTTTYCAMGEWIEGEQVAVNKRHFQSGQVAEYLYWCDMMMDLMRAYVPRSWGNYKSESDCGGGALCYVDLEDDDYGTLARCSCYYGYHEFYDWAKPEYKQKPSDYVVTSTRVYAGWEKDSAFGSSCCDPSDGDPRWAIAVDPFIHGTDAEDNLYIEITDTTIIDANFDYTRTILCADGTIRMLDFDHGEDLTLTTITGATCLDVMSEGRKYLCATSGGNIHIIWANGQKAFINSNGISLQPYTTGASVFITKIKAHFGMADVNPVVRRDVDHYPPKVLEDCIGKCYVLTDDVVYCVSLIQNSVSADAETRFYCNHGAAVIGFEQLETMLVTWGADGRIKFWATEETEGETAGTLLNTIEVHRDRSEKVICSFLNRQGRFFKQGAPGYWVSMDWQEATPHIYFWHDYDLITSVGGSYIINPIEDSIIGSGTVSCLSLYPALVGTTTGMVKVPFTLLSFIDDWDAGEYQSKFPFSDSINLNVPADSDMDDYIVKIQKGVCCLEQNKESDYIRSPFGDNGHIRMSSSTTLAGEFISSGIADIMWKRTVVDEEYADGCTYDEIGSTDFLNKTNLKSSFTGLDFLEDPCTPETYEGRLTFQYNVAHQEPGITIFKAIIVPGTTPPEGSFPNALNVSYRKVEELMFNRDLEHYDKFDMSWYSGVLDKTIVAYNTSGSYHTFLPGMFESMHFRLENFSGVNFPLDPDDPYYTYKEMDGVKYVTYNAVSSTWPTIGAGFSDDPLTITFYDLPNQPAFDNTGPYGVKQGYLNVYLRGVLPIISMEAY